jgi:glycosyltransferase involved in cell wall biosynthesis
LALVVGQAWEAESPREALPEHVYINSSVLTPTEVAIEVSKSKVGLILSEMEGACYSSSEYLLSGIPVVSTWSKGGREIWYNDYNSIICNPNEDEVAEAVTEMCKRNIDSTEIRGGHLRLAKEFRNKFIDSIDNILVECGDHKIGPAYFKRNFINKTFIKQIPKFYELFPAN